jgi:hypothetical protein
VSLSPDHFPLSAVGNEIKAAITGTTLLTAKDAATAIVVTALANENHELRKRFYQGGQVPIAVVFESTGTLVGSFN